MHELGARGTGEPGGEATGREAARLRRGTGAAQMIYRPPRPTAFRRARARLRSVRVGFHPIVGGLMLVLLGFHALTFRPELWWGDSYQYVLHAQNLIAGRPYAATGYLPSPYSFIAPAAYPPGYPVLLAPVLAVTGLNAQAIALLGSLFVLATAWVTATLARGWLPEPFAITIAVLIGLQPGLIAMSRVPLSDPSFVFFVLLCLWMAERASYQTERWTRWALVAGLALGAAALTRTLGLVLIPALLAPGLLRHRTLERPALRAVGIGAALWLVVSLIPLGATSVGGEAAGHGPLVQTDVLRQLAEVPARIPARLVDYTRASFPLWEVPGVDVLKNLLFAAALVPVGVGGLHRVRRRLGPAEAFAVLYVLALLPWASSGTRYLYPLYPIYYLYLVVGVWRLGRDRLARQWALTAALAAAVTFSYGGRYVRWAIGPPSALVDARDLAVYEALRTSTPDDAIVLTTSDPRPAVYYAERRVSHGPDTVAEWLAYADATGATYALVRDDSEVARGLLRDGRHQLVERDGRLTLYRVCETACVGASVNR